MLKAISDRRSIRAYSPGAPVSDSQVHNMLEAAMMAPSAHNGRPWEFWVVRDRALLDALCDAHPYAKMLKTASMAIIVCLAQRDCDAVDVDFLAQDGGAATQT
ncbi:MAG: nitroreductase family protein, partial [Clostridia bacterium]|nr:nitroreductase family protein [Clostridia bacterium]